MPPVSSPAKSKTSDRSTQIEGGTENEQSSTSTKHAKEKFFSTALSRSIFMSALVMAAFLSIISLLTDRYELAPIPSSPNIVVYKLDRLTGGLMFCTAKECSDVKSVK